MKEIMCNEISVNSFERLSYIDWDIQKKLREQECVNCNEEFGKEHIRYVVCSNGKVRWWCAYHGDVVETKKRLKSNKNKK